MSKVYGIHRQHVQKTELHPAFFLTGGGSEMAKITKVKTGNPFEDRESFSRVIVVGNWIFSSNTAGRNLKTQVMPETAHEQATHAFDNVDAALRSVGSCLADVIRSRVTIPNPADVPAVMAVVGERFRNIDPVSTVTCAPLALEYLKFELEVTAFRGSASAQTECLIVTL